MSGGSVGVSSGAAAVRVRGGTTGALAAVPPDTLLPVGPVQRYPNFKVAQPYTIVPFRELYVFGS